MKEEVYFVCKSGRRDMWRGRLRGTYYRIKSCSLYDVISQELKGLSELKIESVDALSEYILEFDWDMIDIDLWEGGNSFQNVFARQMLDCITEIVLLYINNENWYLADYITDGLCAALQFSDYYVNHEA